MPFIIRPLKHTDYDAWSVLWKQYLSFYKTDLSDDISSKTWERLILDGISPHGLCAVDEHGTIIGFTHYLFHASCWTIGPYCYLQDLFVDTKQRKPGIGKALIEAVYQAADAHGADQVYWMTEHDNTRARHLYDQVATLTPFIKYQKP